MLDVAIPWDKALETLNVKLGPNLRRRDWFNLGGARDCTRHGLLLHNNNNKVKEVKGLGIGPIASISGLAKVRQLCATQRPHGMPQGGLLSCFPFCRSSWTLTPQGGNLPAFMNNNARSIQYTSAWQVELQLDLPGTTPSFPVLTGKFDLHSGFP